MSSASEYFKSIPSALANAAADYIANSDFVSRTIGMANSYEGITFLVQSLGREPISLLGKDYLYIFDHVRRNYIQGTQNMNENYNECPKFTFYKEKPTIRFADVDNDPSSLEATWIPSIEFADTIYDNTDYHYAEGDDDNAIDRTINETQANQGTAHGSKSLSFNNLTTCDMVGKTNAFFKKGKYRTLISRFHTNSQDSKFLFDPKQTAVSHTYGMSHGRNLLKKSDVENINGYDNPYCRVWTHHYQYNQLARAIRPFGDISTEEALESAEGMGDANNVSFKVKASETYGFDGSSKRLDKYGVMNYDTNLVNIAPTATVKDYFEHKADKKTPIKRCMFSIENLAWREKGVRNDQLDEYGLSPEQKGPFGGRIMWFPPYDLSFSEDVSVNWNQNDFIGRGEKVYTYTNTERRGNLSFTLLIDHPSIIDYWSGHKRNGQKNNGETLSDGNSGGVDNTMNQEQTLLRFFAGCDVLTATPQKYKIRVWKQKEQKPPTPPAPAPPEVEVVPPKQKTIHCVLYYPNNYSGIDDAPSNSSSVVNAVDYLMNGIGAQKYINNNNDAEDIPTVKDANVSILGTTQSSLRWGGYEIAKPISVAEHNIAWNGSSTMSDRYNIIKSTYADTVSAQRKAQRLTPNTGCSDSDGTGTYIAQYSNFNDDGSTSISSPSYPLAKIVGSEALSLSAANKAGNFRSGSYVWYWKRWYYRVDKAYENQKLITPDSYLDIACSGLNGTGYTVLQQRLDLMQAFGFDNEDKDAVLIGFTDLYVGLENSETVKKVIGESNYTEANVQLVRDIMTNTKKYKINSISFEGHASAAGYADLNVDLAKNRAMTFKKWMQSKKFPNVDEATIGVQPKSKQDNVNGGHNSTLNTKLWRSASVIIKYTEYDLENATITDTDPNVDKMSSDPATSVTFSGSTDGNMNEGYTLPTLTVAQQRQGKLDDLRPKIGMDGIQGYEYPAWRLSDELTENYWSWDSTGNSDFLVSDEMNVPRYDNEGEFFETLAKDDPFLHHLITQKIRYFDPAFHSVSPEGFNARLTFLHQCTRQGSTVENGGGFKQTAYNLAFGRPPICVLRIGDFYYTKIIINSLSINYETPQWDLNPEGIGVMPMFAKVNISFVFLGGSDLAGPISRLQNAVSFNYYANTGVYDNRAEMVEYDSEGKGKEIKFKPYSYPDMMATNGLPPSANTITKK